MGDADLEDHPAAAYAEALDALFLIARFEYTNGVHPYRCRFVVEGVYPLCKTLIINRRILEQYDKYHGAWIDQPSPRSKDVGAKLGRVTIGDIVRPGLPPWQILIEQRHRAWLSGFSRLFAPTGNILRAFDIGPSNVTNNPSVLAYYGEISGSSSKIPRAQSNFWSEPVAEIFDIVPLRDWMKTT